MSKFAFTGRQTNGKLPTMGSTVWVVGQQFSVFLGVLAFAGWLGALGISEVSKALISGVLGFYPALFKLRFVAAFGISRWGGQFPGCPIAQAFLGSRYPLFSGFSVVFLHTRCP